MVALGAKELQRRTVEQGSGSAQGSPGLVEELRGVQNLERARIEWSKAGVTPKKEEKFLENVEPAPERPKEEALKVW